MKVVSFALLVVGGAACVPSANLGSSASGCADLEQQCASCGQAGEPPCQAPCDCAAACECAAACDTTCEERNRTSAEGLGTTCSYSVSPSCVDAGTAPDPTVTCKDA